jgi:hypothetical protein
MAKVVQAVSVGKQLCRIGIQVSREVTEESGSAGAAETSLRTKLPRFLNRTPTPLLPPIPYVALSPTTDVQLFPFVTLLLTSGVADSWVSIVGECRAKTVEVSEAPAAVSSQRVANQQKNAAWERGNGRTSCVDEGSELSEQSRQFRMLTDFFWLAADRRQQRPSDHWRLSLRVTPLRYLSNVTGGAVSSLNSQSGRPCRSELNGPGKLNPRGFVSSLKTPTHPARRHGQVCS